MLQFGSAKRKAACQFQRESCSAVQTCMGWYLPGDGPAHFCRGHLHEAGGGHTTLGSPVHLGKAWSPQLHDALVGHNDHLVLHTPQFGLATHLHCFHLCLASLAAAEHTYSRSIYWCKVQREQNMMIVLLVTIQIAIWGLTQRQALVPRSAMQQQQQQDMSHNQQAVQQEPHIWEQHALFIGVHVEAAALPLAAGAHPTRILGPPQQCLPYLLHPCNTHTSCESRESFRAATLTFSH